ncbi:MAG: M23 family metallopeptidase [Paludibacteraceae bacterium]|nr:M23 family metallopeptidase [Paludibacteraceae bacterium]
MTDDKKKISFWKRLRNKYRISVINEETLAERWYLHLSAWGAIVVTALLFLLTLVLFSLVILYTPVKNYLPGYSEEIRQQLIEESVKVDSIGESLELQRQYLNIIKQVVAGEVHSDTIQSLDSMQIIMREQLLEAKNQATEEFIAQYEDKEKDYLQLFDIANTTPVLSFFRPAHGVIVEQFDEKQKQYSITLQTPARENVTAILAGTIVYLNYELTDTYTLILQHDNYISIYKGISKMIKQVGDHVQAGESIAMLENSPLQFELWQNGKPINPEEVIAF